MTRELSSADIDAYTTLIERQHAEYMAKVQKRHEQDFPAEEELRRRIEAAEADIERHNAEYNSIMAEAANEETKLPPLREKLRKAEAAEAAQRSTIQLLTNKANRARDHANIAARNKAAFEAQLENKDYDRFRKAAG